MSGIDFLDYGYITAHLGLRDDNGFNLYEPSKLIEVLNRIDVHITESEEYVSRIIRILSDLNYVPCRISTIKIKHGHSVVAVHGFFPPAEVTLDP